MKLNSSIMELKLLEASGNTHAFTVPIADAAKALGKKTLKVVKAVEEYVANPGCLKQKAILTLIAQCSLNEKEREDLKKWAIRLGVQVSDGSGKKRRKTMD